MKKLTVGLAVLLSGYAANSLAALPTGNTSRCDVCVPSYCGGFTFGLTGLYWRATSSQQDFALTFPTFDSSFGFGGGDDGNHHNLNHDYKWGFKANIGYVFPCSGNDVVLTYTHWNNNRNRGIGTEFGAVFPTTSAPFFGAEDSVFQAPFLLATPIELSGSVIVSDGETVEVGFEGFLNEILVPFDPTNITAVSAHSRFQDHTWDLEFGQSMNIGCNFRLRWLGGLRYTRLKHDLHVRHDFAIAETDIALEPTTTVVFSVFDDDDSVIGSVDPVVDVTATLRDFVRQSSDFNGIGPRFGFDGSYHVGGGFGVVGSLSASLLVGRTQSHFRERIEGEGVVTFLPTTTVELEDLTAEGSTVSDVFLDPVSGTSVITFDPTFSTVSFRHPHEDRVVPNIDAKLGLDWTYQFCNCSRSKLTIEAGYLVSHYFNAIDRLSGIEAIAPETRPRQTLDVSFDGPYVGVQVNL